MWCVLQKVSRLRGFYVECSPEGGAEGEGSMWCVLQKVEQSERVLCGVFSIRWNRLRGFYVVCSPEGGAVRRGF